jgi:hypothetical protein
MPIRVISATTPIAIPMPIPILVPLGRPLSVDCEAEGVGVVVVVAEEAGVVVLVDVAGGLLSGIPVDCTMAVFVMALGARAWKTSFVGTSQWGPSLVAPQHAHRLLVALYTISVWRPLLDESEVVQCSVQTVEFPYETSVQPPI